MENLPARLERVVVHNKIDLVGVQPSTHKGQGVTEVRVSAKTGEGLDLLCEVLLEAAGWRQVVAGETGSIWERGST